MKDSSGNIAKIFTENYEYILYENEVFGKKHQDSQYNNFGSYNDFLKDLDSTITQSRQSTDYSAQAQQPFFFRSSVTISFPTPVGQLLTFKPGAILWNDRRESPFLATGVSPDTSTWVGNASPMPFYEQPQASQPQIVQQYYSVPQNQKPLQQTIQQYSIPHLQSYSNSVVSLLYAGNNINISLIANHTTPQSTISPTSHRQFYDQRSQGLVQQGFAQGFVQARG